MNLTETKLLELLDRYCSGELGNTEGELLAAALHDSEKARTIFIRYMDLHHGLSWEASTAADMDELLATADVRLVSDESVTTDLDREGLSRWRRFGQFFVRTRPRVAVTVASGFLALLLCMAAFLPAYREQIKSADDSEPSIDRIVAAQITGSVDCVWQDKALPLGFGTQLYKGQQIELLKGTAEVTFKSGVEVTLQGPAVYVIDSVLRSSLRHGELTALVPPGAEGFAVQTPSLTIVDLGTEFGVAVSPTKTDDEIPVEEVHVFVGEVELSVRDSGSPPQRLKKDQAIRFTRGGQIQRLDASQRRQFPQPIATSSDTTTGEDVPADAQPPVTEGLTLWLSADGTVQTDSLGFVKAWEDRLIGDNENAQNATQHLSQQQPRWLAGAINGKPAIRFDGDDVLALGTPDSLGILNQPYEMFIVARSSAPGIQFLVAGGVEDFEIHFNGDAGARFIPAGFSGVGDGSDVATTGTFTNGRPHVLSARVEAGLAHRGILAVDGKHRGSRTSGDRRSANNTTLRLGLRHDGSMGFTGDLAEVLIYRGGLTDAQRRKVEQYLMKKYGVTASGL